MSSHQLPPGIECSFGVRVRLLSFRAVAVVNTGYNSSQPIRCTKQFQSLGTENHQLENKKKLTTIFSIQDQVNVEKRLLI